MSSRIQRDYVSFSAANKECGWFHLCRLNHLHVDENMWVQQPDGKFAQVPFDWLSMGVSVRHTGSARVRWGTVRVSKSNVGI